MTQLTSHYFDLFEKIYAKNNSYYKESLNRFPNNANDEMDLRVAIFGIPGNALSAYQVAMGLMESSLLPEEWWAAHSLIKTNEEIRSIISIYERTMRQGYYVHYLSSVEWILRNMVVIACPGTCEDGFAEFKSIYDCLLARIGKKEYVTIFDIARNLRNTIHNNGRYCGRGKKDSPIWTYRGRQIQFKHGALIDDATPLSFDLFDDLIESCKGIIYSPTISAFAHMEFPLEQ